MGLGPFCCTDSRIPFPPPPSDPSSARPIGLQEEAAPAVEAAEAAEAAEAWCPRCHGTGRVPSAVQWHQFFFQLFCGFPTKKKDRGPSP